MNKLANEQIMSVYLFVMLFIVAGGIVLITSIFYGKQFDVREVEANLLVNYIGDCISSGGKMKIDVNYFDDSNVLEICKINLNVEDVYGWEKDQIYFRISFFDFVTEKPIKTIEGGNSNFVEFCNQGKKNPVCIEKNLFTLDKDGREVLVKVFTAIRKTEKNE